MIKDDVVYRPHQELVISKATNATEFAIFHDMGRGKTLSAIAVAFNKFYLNEINLHLVIPLNFIKNVWIEQYDRFAESGSYEIFVMESGRQKSLQKFLDKKFHGLKVLVMAVESFSQGRAFDLAWDLVNNYKVQITVDESTSIKNPQSMRTKKMFKLGRKAKVRLVLTGTPNPQGLEDLYAQFYFLDPHIIGLKSFFVFKNRYCILGGFENRKIIGYQSEQELYTKIRNHCDVVKVDESVMPQRSWQHIVVPLTPEQKKILKQLEDSFGANLGGLELETNTILERLTRFQQVIGGSFPYEEDDEYKVEALAKIPKLDALVEQIQLMPADAKVIIWARFVPEIERIVAKLESLNIGKISQFHGGVSDEDRFKMVDNFQNGDARFMISNKSGARGQTWTAASYSVYYSNDFSYEIREQSERRNWGRDDNGHDVVYIDIEADSKYDRMILAAVKRKKDLAEIIKSELMK